MNLFVVEGFPEAVEKFQKESGTKRILFLILFNTLWKNFLQILCSTCVLSGHGYVLIKKQQK